MTFLFVDWYDGIVSVSMNHLLCSNHAHHLAMINSMLDKWENRKLSKHTRPKLECTMQNICLAAMWSRVAQLEWIRAQVPTEHTTHTMCWKIETMRNRKRPDSVSVLVYVRPFRVVQLNLFTAICSRNVQLVVRMRQLSQRIKLNYRKRRSHRLECASRAGLKMFCWRGAICLINAS